MKSSHVWLLKTAAYRLVNANAKRQNKSDQALMNLGLKQSKHINQLFYKYEDSKLCLIVAKVVDDIKAAGPGDNAVNFFSAFNQMFTLGTINSGPGNLRFFGINVVQQENMTVETNSDDKIDSLFEYSISRYRQKQSECPANEIEKRSFMSLNSSLGWIGSAASPMCSYYSSYLQHRAPNVLVKHIVEQNNILRKSRSMVL